MNCIMNKSFLNKSSTLLLTCLILTSCQIGEGNKSRVAKLPFYNEATYTPQWIIEKEVANDFHQIPAFQLVDQEGDQITEQHLNDRITVVDFFFTSCPGICPKMTSNMMMVQEAFLSDDGVQILSHSVTPEYDSIPVLKEYAELKGIQKDKWHLLTGERSVIYDLGRNQYFIEEDLGLEKDPEDFIHTENFVLIDKNRRIRGIYNGLNKTSVRQLIADVKTLL